jgi:phosphohistidine phosphatase SixA
MWHDARPVTTDQSQISRVIVLRHASAGRRDDADELDSERSLDGLGQEVSRLLARSLAAHRPASIASSPAARCVETLAPLVEHLGMPLEIRHELGIGATGEDVRRLLAESRHGALLCTHREVIAELVGHERVPTKGDALILSHINGEILSIEKLAAPTLELALQSR